MSIPSTITRNGIVSREFSDILFTALRTVERALPLLAAGAVLIDPTDEPIIESSQRMLSKLFESLVSLRDTASLEQLEASARKSTDASWQDSIDAKFRIDSALAEIRRLASAP